MCSAQLAFTHSSDIVRTRTMFAESAIQKATKFHQPHFLRSGGTIASCQFFVACERVENNYPDASHRWSTSAEH